MEVMTKHFFDYLDDFFRYRQTVYEASPQTLKSNRTDLLLFEKFMLANKLTKIDGHSVIAFQYYLKQQRCNCGASINRKIYSLRSYANFLRLCDLPGANKLPFYDVLKIRQGYRKRPDALEIEHITSFFNAIDLNSILGIRDYAVYALMYQLGLRVGEVHALDLDDIDFQQHQISVLGKGKKPRRLHLNPQLKQILIRSIAVRDQFLNAWKKDALFLSKKGNRLAIRTMEDNLKKILVACPLTVPFNITCHSLRHSLASHLKDKDVDVLTIQNILGHSSARSSEIYIHPGRERIRQALEKLPGIIYFKELIQKGLIPMKFQNSATLMRE